VAGEVALALAANALGRLSAVKGAIMGVWETPSAGTLRQVELARADLTKAMTEVQPIVAKAKAMSAKLSSAGITFKVP
jgi:hypothetical protein